jgi:phenylalanine-4-hydroxylase
MEPFLAGGTITRTMTVVLVPVSSHQSRRRIERDLVKLESDASTKEEKGRRVDARHRRATQALLDREEELVAGYPEMAYAGLVTVSARDLDELEEHGEIIEQLARETGMDLRLLDARQDVAWAAALPLGLAPQTLLAT